MKRTAKLALVAGSALTIALAAVAVNAHPEGGWGAGLGYGMGPGYHMGYGMGPGMMGSYGMGPGMMGGYGGYGMGSGGHMGMGTGNHMGYGHGTGLNGPCCFPSAVGGQLDALKATLGITDSQQPAWQAFADSATKEAQNRLAWFDKMHQAKAPRTTPDWLAQQNEAMKQHQADREAVATSLTKLYDALTPEQRVLLDRGPIAQGPRYGQR